MIRSFSRSALLCLVLASTLRGQSGAPSARRPLLFSDDFEHGLSRWIVSGNGDIVVHQTGSDHGGVMRLRSNGDIEALIAGSETWGDVAIEGDLRFADDSDSYLGLVYNYRRRGARSDFGLLYLKYGRRVYLQPNPHRDYNVTRKLYPEYQAPVTGASTVSVGEWQRFRAEVRMDAAGPAILRLSSIDDLAVWLNGRFRGFFTKQADAWVDYWSNPEYRGDLVPLDLVAGQNTLVIRVRGGAYASGGFYARVEGPGVIPPAAP